MSDALFLEKLAKIPIMCPECDGTGFLSDELRYRVADALVQTELEIRATEYLEPTPNPDPLRPVTTDREPRCPSTTWLPYEDDEGFGYRDWHCGLAVGHAGDHQGWLDDAYRATQPDPSPPRSAMGCLYAAVALAGALLGGLAMWLVTRL